LKLSVLDEQGQVPAALLSLVPTGYTVLAGREERQFIVTSSAALTGAYLTNAIVKVGGEYGRPYVSIDFNKEGGKMFSDLTERNVGKNLAIVLDGVVQSAPVIRTRIPDGHAIIEGSFTPDDAKNLSIVLRAGSLPVPLLMEENRTVGPTLGLDSIRQGRIATVVAVLLVIAFMAFYYRVSGMIAGFGLIQNLVYLMGALAALHATLTLPGIAGIILTMGMSVDANVLIFERIREELRQGKTTRLAIDAGYDKAFSSILDSHVTTLITALVLFQFGTGPVKGFAVTLSLGVAISLFSALVGTKVVYDWMGRNFALARLSI
ncbi:MAG: protein translocase subunit SecD, partial [bacterium]